MFSNIYQGGAVVELLTGQGKNPTAKWKLSGGRSAIQKKYDKEVKGFVFSLEGSSYLVKMQIPANDRQSLGLHQSLLVFQVNIPEGKDFSIDLVISGLDYLKKRLHLSTVNKELSVTPLHARIPIGGLKRDSWSNLCINLESFARELFKGFLKLDAISLSASCKVRRIFTMKTEPTATSVGATFRSEGGLTDLIPQSFQFPPNVSHVTQLLEVQKTLLNSDPELAPAPSTSHLRTRTQNDSSTASGSRVPVSFVQTGIKKTEAAQDKNEPSSLKMKSSSSRMNKTAKKQEVFFSNQKPHHVHFEDEYSCSTASKSSGAPPITRVSVPCSDRQVFPCDLQLCSTSEDNEECEPQLKVQEEVFSFLSHPLLPKEEGGQFDQENTEVENDQVKSNSGRRHEAQPEDDFIGSDSDEDNIQETCQQRNAFDESNCAASRYCSPTLDVQIEDHPTFPNMNQTALQHHSPSTTSLQVLSVGNARPSETVPSRCLSPDLTSSRHENSCGLDRSWVVGKNICANSSVSPSESLSYKVKLNDFREHKETDSKGGKPLKPGDSSGSNLQKFSSLRLYEEELQMLASLKRQQEEDDCRASGLSASQIYQYDVSISISSDDASTWTHNSMPANQGHHYQKEMNPLQQSNPRDLMDMLSPPIMTPGQQGRSGNTWNDQENLSKEEDGTLVEGKEDEYLNLLYDPHLNCYFDPVTEIYYTLA